MDGVAPLGSQVLTDHRHGSNQGAIGATSAWSGAAKDGVWPHIISQAGTMSPGGGRGGHARGRGFSITWTFHHPSGSCDSRNPSSEPRVIISLIFLPVLSTGVSSYANGGISDGGGGAWKLLLRRRSWVRGADARVRKQREERRRSSSDLKFRCVREQRLKCRRVSSPGSLNASM